MADFEISFKKTEGWEGVNVWTRIDGDSGEETWSGISRKANPKWAGWAILDKIPNKKNNQVIKSDELEKLKRGLYRNNYWNPIWGDRIKYQESANSIYDMAVNLGVGTSIKRVQLALKMEETGKMTESLLNKINSVRL